MVSSYTQLLSRRYQGKIDSNADEFIGFIVDGVKRMQGLIRDLLEYSRVTTRRKVPVLVDSTPLLEQVLANLKTAIEESDATVTHEPLPMVPVDDVQFGQLMQQRHARVFQHAALLGQISAAAEILTLAADHDHLDVVVDVALVDDVGVELPHPQTGRVLRVGPVERVDRKV